MAFDHAQLDGIDPALDEALAAREGTLRALCQKVAEFLGAVEDFATHSALIIVEDLETLPKCLDDVLTGIAPLLLIIRVVSAIDKAKGVRGVLRFDPLTLEVRILENPKTNRGAAGTHITRNKAAELVALALKCRRIASSFLALEAIEEASPGEGLKNDVLATAVTFTLSAELL